MNIRIIMVLSMLVAVTSGYWIGLHGYRLSTLINPETGGVANISGDPSNDTITSDNARPAVGRILYYRHPMGLSDISQTPKKDSMGMDYIPVYADESGVGSSINISPAKIQKLGVQSEAAKIRIISEPVRAPGTIQLDESRTAVISLRSEAFVETVENITTGSEVRNGSPLMHLYSPAVTAAAAEYLYNLKSGVGEASLRAVRQQLLNLAVPSDFIENIERNREIPLTFTWTSPREGIVFERNIMDGMRVMPGDVLFRIADHSVIWALVDIAERDLSSIAIDQPVIVRVRSYPDRSFPGKIALIYPHLNPKTRTVTVRIELANPDFLLRPDMYAEAEIDTGNGQPVLAVPDHALISSGDSEYVLIDRGEGRFEPHSILTGLRGAGYVEVRAGINENDRVVISANFLIDAESNLKSALNSLISEGSP